MSQARNSGIGGAHTRLLHPAARKFVKVPALSRAMLPNPSLAVLSIQITESLSLSLSPPFFEYFVVAYGAVTPLWTYTTLFPKLI